MTGKGGKRGVERLLGFSKARSSMTGRGEREGGGARGRGFKEFTFSKASSVMTGLLAFPCLPGTCTGVTSCTIHILMYINKTEGFDGPSTERLHVSVACCLFSTQRMCAYV